MHQDADIDRDPGGDGSRRWRCFWAALPEMGSQQRLSRWMEELQAVGRGDWRWISPRNWHLTLSFLGPISAQQASRLGEVLGSRAFAAPLKLDLREIAPFPRGRPRTLAALLEADPALLDWVEYLRKCSAELGLRQECRAYRAHLTMARTRRPGRIGEPVLRAPGHLRFDRIALLRSHLGPGGARYQSLAAKAAASASDPSAVLKEPTDDLD